MTAHERIQASAAGLAALPEDDPERVAAEVHGQTCEACAAALQEGAQIIALLAATTPLSPPSPEALNRASAGILAELGAARPASAQHPRGRARFSLGLFGAGLSAWAIPLALSRHRPPFGPSWAISGAVAAVAALAAALAFAAGGVLLGLVPLGSALFALADGSTGGLYPGIGLRCVIAELMSAALPLVSAVVIARRRGLGGVTEIAAAAAAGALIGQAVLHLTCPVSTATPHLFLFHTGGVLLAGFGGGIAGRLFARR